MYSSDNVTTKREKVHKNCWECDNVAKGRGTCLCGTEDRRVKKRRAKQRFQRDLREGQHDY